MQWVWSFCTSERKWWYTLLLCSRIIVQKSLLDPSRRVAKLLMFKQDRQGTFPTHRLSARRFHTWWRLAGHRVLWCVVLAYSFWYHCLIGWWPKCKWNNGDSRALVSSYYILRIEVLVFATCRVHFRCCYPRRRKVVWDKQSMLSLAKVHMNQTALHHFFQKQSHFHYNIIKETDADQEV